MAFARAIRQVRDLPIGTLGQLEAGQQSEKIASAVSTHRDARSCPEVERRCWRQSQGAMGAG